LRESFEVSPEMTVLIGEGAIGAPTLPPGASALWFGCDGADGAPTLRCFETFDADALAPLGDGLILAVATAACSRIFGTTLHGFGGDAFHVPTPLRMIALQIRECRMPGESRTTYRLAKSIELLCETFALICEGGLVPMCRDGILSLADSRRVLAARRLIDERWNEKLTLDRIGRACGLNRAKLTRGFREMFDCTVAVALAERRLTAASEMLRTTDRPVSSIGYEAGYLNNASFARAFARRFGVSPSDYRASRLAA
jgi:AraC family transcriptional regulator, transcriptional activator of the genes for pyochelin and ferripyochelin receptors